MSIKITTTNLAEIKAIAEDLLTKSEEAETIAAKKEIDDDLDYVVGYYKNISKTSAYAAAKASGDPMQYAIREFFYPAIKVKETKDKDTGIVLRSVEDAIAPLDLGDMHKKLGGIGANKNWIYMAEKLNYYLTINAANRVGATIKHDSMTMKEISKDIDLGKNPCSKTNMLKTLQAVITAMLGDGYKVTSHDVNYLTDVYANDVKKSKTSISAANHSTLRGYLKKVCYRILSGRKGYDVEQREIREKTSAAVPEAESAKPENPAEPAISESTAKEPELVDNTEEESAE